MVIVRVVQQYQVNLQPTIHQTLKILQNLTVMNRLTEVFISKLIWLLKFLHLLPENLFKVD
jgi:hypothetical protein